MSEVSIVPVRSASDLKRFIRLPAILYADDPNFVPQLEMEPPPGGDGTPPVEEGLPPEGTVNSTEAPPAPGAAEMSGSG